MTDFDSLREDFAQAFTAINDYAQAQRRHAEATTLDLARLWADNAELRDELHAVANRLENLTRAVTAEPAEVAERIYGQPVRDVRGLTQPETLTDG